LCINKIGHALHELDPVFNAFSHQKLLGDIAEDLGVKQPQIRQSMYIFKQPRIGGEVNWHQDASFFYTQPQSVVTFWFAIEDATINNGCLWVEPRGHKGPLRERFNLTEQVTTMQSLDNTPWPTSTEGESVEVKAGSVVIFQGLLPHYSAPNRSEKSRQAYTIHVTDGTTEYASENWLQTKVLPLRGFNRE
jgi:phytanoyl-CoA hydroxylase